MNYDEEEESEDGFKIGGADGDELPELPEEDFGLDDEDPDHDK
jgi:hypothetical protein